MSTQQGMALLDTARALDTSLLVPVNLDHATLRKQASDGDLPPLLRGLVRAPKPTAAQATSNGHAATFIRQLAQATESQRGRLVMDLVGATAAAVLGYDSKAAVDPDRGFLALGFDSLTAVELRNRLNAVTGLRLPSTLLFDCPTPTALADYLRAELAPGSAGESPLAMLDQLEAMLSSTQGETRDQLTERLRRLVSELDDGEDVPDLSTVTDDELFGLIDNDLRDL